MLLLGLGFLASLTALIVLPVCVRWVDEQLGYVVLVIGGAMLALALRLGMLQFDAGSFVQMLLGGQRQELHSLLLESWVLLGWYFCLSLLARVFHRPLARGIGWVVRRTDAPLMIFLWTLFAGSLGSVSVVVMAVLGGIFFSTVQEVTRRDYTACAVLYAAAIGISALLTTVGEPLSLFLARTLGQGNGYLLRTFGPIVALNILALACGAWMLARRAKPLHEHAEERMMRDVHRAERTRLARKEGTAVADALASVEEFEQETHDFSHHLDDVLHSTSKLYFFILGLLLFSEAVRPLADLLLARLPLPGLFFGNALSAVADNALLGLLEIQRGMPRERVLVAGLSLAFWGVGLVPGNVCNVVLKEKLKIPFGRWALIGMPCALGLAALNGLILGTGLWRWLVF